MSGKQAKKARQEAKANESDKERLERLAKNTNFRLLKPFGPAVGLFHMPSEMTQALLKRQMKFLKIKTE